MKKPRKKKFNRNQSVRRQIAPLLRTSAVSFITGDDHCKLIHPTTGELALISPTIIHYLSNLPHIWNIHMAVFGRDEKGEQYIKATARTTKTHYRQADLEEYLNNEHSALIKKFNSKHFIGAGWLASPCGYDWDEEEAFKIFTDLGAYKRFRDPDTGDIVITL